MAISPEQFTRRACALKAVVLDVDGVLTDGAIIYGNEKEELKAFNIKDGVGIKLLQAAGLTVAIITGRSSNVVLRRSADLSIDRVIQGREDKRAALLELCEELAISPADCAYMGDDLPDLGAIAIAGLGLTVADAATSVAEAADWQSVAQGGQGAVREAAEAILRARNVLEQLENAYR
ncbi:MAG: HAD-IIIA family hydrolase [Pseudomonadota bacterium]